MTWLALAAAGGAAPPERFDNINSITAAIVTIVGAISAVIVTVIKARQASQENVPADEREARVGTNKAERTALAEWQEIVAQKDRDIAAVQADRDRWKRIAEEYERLHDEDRAVRMVHGAWDFTTYEAAYRAGLPVSPPPPLTAPRTPREVG